MGTKNDLKLFVKIIVCLIFYIVVSCLIPIYLSNTVKIFDEEAEDVFDINIENLVIFYNGIEYVDKDKEGNFMSSTWILDEALGEEITVEVYIEDEEGESFKAKAYKYENDEQMDFLSWDGFLYCKKSLNFPDYKKDMEQVEAIVLVDEMENEVGIISDKEEIVCLMNDLVASANEEMWDEERYASFGFQDMEEEYYIHLKFKDVKPVFSAGGFARNESGQYALENYEAIWATELWGLSEQSQEIMKKYLK